MLPERCSFSANRDLTCSCRARTRVSSNSSGQAVIPNAVHALPTPLSGSNRTVKGVTREFGGRTNSDESAVASEFINEFAAEAKRVSPALAVTKTPGVYSSFAWSALVGVGRNVSKSRCESAEEEKMEMWASGWVRVRGLGNVVVWGGMRGTHAIVLFLRPPCILRCSLHDLVAVSNTCIVLSTN